MSSVVVRIVQGFKIKNNYKQKCYDISNVIALIFYSSNGLSFGLTVFNNPRYRQISWVIVTYQSNGFVVGIDIGFVKTNHIHSQGLINYPENRDFKRVFITSHIVSLNLTYSRILWVNHGCRG